MHLLRRVGEENRRFPPLYEGFFAPFDAFFLTFRRFAAIMTGTERVKYSEVTSINKQKFLAELSKLLTFMYEEDRQRAIELYSRMFDESADERALLQTLNSPTRQAVIVARAYNSNLGKLSLTAESKAAPEDRDENGVPDYVQAIEAVREQAWAAQGLSAEPEAESTAEPETEAESVEEPETAEEADTEAESSAEEAEAVEEPEAKAEQVEEPEAAEGSEEPEAERAEEPKTAEEAEAVEEAGAKAEQVEEPEAEAAEEPSEEPEAELQEAPAAAPAEEMKAEKLDGIEYFTMPEAGKETTAEDAGSLLLDENSFNVDSDALKKSRRKPRVFLLILYILLAIPLTICAVAVLLVPALLCLALSIAAIICGVVLVSTAISSIAALALLCDIMVMIGVALVLFALGLFFLWTAIWFIGGAIVGLIHGVAALCDKWCYKEVSEA